MKDKLEQWMDEAHDAYLKQVWNKKHPHSIEEAVATHVARKVLEEVEGQGHIDKAEGYIHIPLVYWEDLIQSLDGEGE